MASSPDTRQYVDLTVFDEDTVSILNDILTTGRGLLPEWVPEAGQIELVLAEAFAVRSAELAAAINRIPDATTEVLLQLFGLSRSDGEKATATLTITFTDSDVIPRSLPAGTQFLYINAVTNVSYIFTLDENFSLSGSLTGTAAVTASTVGAQYNFSADGMSLSLLSNASFFSSATFSVSPSGGSNPESDSEYFNRGMTLLASYTTASTTASQIKYYVAANKSYANRVEVYNRRRYRDRDTTSPYYSTHVGSVLVVVGSTVSTFSSAASQLPVASSNLSELYSSLAERTPSGLTIDVMSAELAQVDVTATVQKKSGYNASTVKTAVENSIKAFLDPNMWDLNNQYVRRNELIALIDATEGVDYVSSLQMNGKTLIGAYNVGHYAESGGTKATFTVNISGAAASKSYGAGEASIYFVYSGSASAVPTVLMFVNESFTTDGSGAATGVTYTAVNNGLDFNDTSNSGLVTAGFTGWSPVTGDWADSTIGSIVFSSTSAISGGSNNSEIFTPLDSSTDDDVDSDIYLRNLGTLVVYGTLNITVE